ncbi:TetR family transcriptional regulator [Sinobaca sp. H24]|uniref:TetR family transcriptional regulator n=1 Tax=Sinobaca sp. H24 TaxID=2923376 RepID=UPI0027E38383|nr:TetR family transcriptional regulator [Sinobaca sp. H24]
MIVIHSQEGYIIDTTKKERILQSAINVFSEQGLEKTKVADIVKQAGIAQGTFYLYFPSKYALIPAIAEKLLDDILTIMEERVTADQKFEEKIAAIVDATFEITAEYKDVLALCYSGLSLSGALQEWEKIYEPYYRWMDGLLEEAVRNKEIRPGIRIRITSKMLIGVMEESAEQVYLFDEHYDGSREYREELKLFIIQGLK